MNLNHILGIIIRNLYIWIYEIDRVFDLLWWSFFDIAIWGFMSKYYTQGIADSNIGIQILAGLVLWTALIRSQWEISSTLIIESWDRNLINIFVSPISLAEFFTASVVMGLIKLVAATLFTSLVAIVLVHFNIMILNWWIIPLLMNIFLTGIWLAFIINALVIRFGKNVITLAWSLVFLLNPISGVVYPLSALPLWLQYVSRLIPTAYIFEAMRGLLKTGEMNINILLIGFGLNMLYLVLSIMLYRFAFIKAREHGWLIKLV